MTAEISPEDFANRLCAELIRQGLLIDGNRAHEVLHAEAMKLFEEVTKEGSK
jgi:hypothetical protein